MLSNILIGAVIYFFTVTLFLNLLQRRYRIPYDRKVVISALLLLLAAFSIWWIPNIEQTPQVNMNFYSKLAWITLLSFGVNTIVQLIFWILYTVITRNDLVKMPRFIFNIVALVILVCSVLFLVKYFFAISLSGLLVTSTVLSAVIGLSLQDTLTNLFAGISLQVESPFTIDDWVNLGGHEGKVVSQNWRSLTLLTRENHRITLPNKYTAEEKIINYSRPSPRQIHSLRVDLDYTHPPNLVKSILAELIQEVEEVDIDQNVFPFIEGYAESGITYCIRFWVGNYGDILIVQDKILSRLWYMLERNSIKIPYPISEVRMDLQSQGEFSNRIEKKRNDVFNQLKGQEWLSDMDESQLKLLAENSKIQKFAINENLVTEGLQGDSMFIVLEGTAKVLVKSKKGKNIYVADKTVGEFFGEMSLLTGEPRTATVRASSDMDVIVIDKKSFVDIVLKDSKILENLMNVLESNRSSLTSIIDDERKKSNTTKNSARKIIMSRIKKYLGIKN